MGEVEASLVRHLCIHTYTDTHRCRRTDVHRHTPVLPKRGLLWDASSHFESPTPAMKISISLESLSLLYLEGKAVNLLRGLNKLIFIKALATVRE